MTKKENRNKTTDNFPGRLFLRFKEIKLMCPEKHSIYFNCNGITLKQNKTHTEEHQLIKGPNGLIILPASGNFQVSRTLDFNRGDFTGLMFYVIALNFKGTRSAS